MRPEQKRKLRMRRHRRVRLKVNGTPQKPRLAVFKSLRHFYAQIIDDEAGTTIATASSLDPDIRNGRAGFNPSVKVCQSVAELLCKKAGEKGISEVVFDHGGFGYKGKIQAFAVKAREGGLKF